MDADVRGILCLELSSYILKCKAPCLLTGIKKSPRKTRKEKTSEFRSVLKRGSEWQDYGECKGDGAGRARSLFFFFFFFFEEKDLIHIFKETQYKLHEGPGKKRNNKRALQTCTKHPEKT